MSKPHNTHYMYTYIHTDYTYTHTYLQTNTYIHQYMHVHTDTPHPATGGRGILYIHTYILTYKYVHTSIHACTYRHATPTHRGGRGEDHLSPLHTKTCAPRPFGGGWGVGPAALDHIYIYKWLVNSLYRKALKDVKIFNERSLGGSACLPLAALQRPLTVSVA